MPVLNFNPRTPCGVRRCVCTLMAFVTKFQSTHPLRGATLLQVRRHDPAQGFQSTHPLRGATAGQIGFYGIISISIHAPLAGCDARPAIGGQKGGISIHAPLAGCDHQLFQRFQGCLYFNPRTPCGVRPFWTTSAAHRNTFQSTHPLRGATIGFFLYLHSYRISIHAPLAGCDAARRCRVCRAFNFNPRTPCGVRQQKRTKKTALFLN